MELLQRVLAVDVLECPRGAGRLELSACIKEPAEANRILDHLGLASQAPPLGRASAPGEDLACDPGPGDTGADPTPEGRSPAPTDSAAARSPGAPGYARSFASGRAESHPVTTQVADGMAVRTPDPNALALIRHGAARIVEVGDQEVEAAMAALFVDTHNVAEGAGAAGLAALLRERELNAGRTVGFVLTGANVDAARFAEVLRRHGVPA